MVGPVLIISNLVQDKLLFATSVLAWLVVLYQTADQYLNSMFFNIFLFSNFEATGGILDVYIKREWKKKTINKIL